MYTDSFRLGQYSLQDNAPTGPSYKSQFSPVIDKINNEMMNVRVYSIFILNLYTAEITMLKKMKTRSKCDRGARFFLWLSHLVIHLLERQGFNLLLRVLCTTGIKIVSIFHYCVLPYLVKYMHYSWLYSCYSFNDEFKSCFINYDTAG